jgi:nicotinate phosphoribosyltransferase
MVYKLVARQNGAGEWISVAKKSPEKATHGGRKHPVRALGASGIATSETIYVGASAPSVVPGRTLHTRLMTDGVADTAYTGAHGVESARERRAIALRELPPEAFRLAAGDPALPTVYVDADPFATRR